MSELHNQYMSFYSYLECNVEDLDMGKTHLQTASEILFHVQYGCTVEEAYQVLVDFYTALDNDIALKRLDEFACEFLLFQIKELLENEI